MAEKKEDVDTESLLKKLSSCQLCHPDPIAEKNKIELISRLRDLNDFNPDSGLCTVRGLFDPNGFHGFHEGHEEVLSENSKKAKETFSTIMLIRPGDNSRDKRMPSKDQLKVLKAIDPALCKTLRDGTVRDFYEILYPKPEEDLQDTVFCLVGTKVDDTIFEDLTERAKLLAKEIKERKIPNQKIKCYLMDGFGRVLLCLIKALIEEGVDPDDDVEFTICEIDDVVHEYHQYVFPSSVVNKKQNVLQDYGEYIENNSVVYLNFCSVPSSQVNKNWKSHPRCVKENVLRFVWELTQPGRNCSVMVSLVIKDESQGREKLFPRIPDPTIQNQGKKYVTCLGFLKVIRDKELFNSEDGDILLRPDKTIKWRNPNTKRIPSSVGLDGNFVHVFASVMIHPKGEEQTEDLIEWFDDNNIAYDSPNDPEPGERVDIIAGNHKDTHGVLVHRRTPCFAWFKLTGSNDEHQVKLTSCRKIINSMDGDILLRPGNIIPWDDYYTERKPSLEGIHGNNVQTFASVMTHPKGEEQTEDLIEWSDENNIAYDSPNDPEPGERVDIIAGNHKGTHGVVQRRTPCYAWVKLAGSNDEHQVKLTSCRKIINSVDGDILLRPGNIIPWDGYYTERKPSLEGIHGNNVQTFASVMTHPKGENNIAYDSLDDPEPGDRVDIIAGNHKGTYGVVQRRTPCYAWVKLAGSNDEYRVKLTSCRKPPRRKLFFENM